ncbi:DHA1 family bicyclomycin/chloramphenicol resistance-like MFS transporter [Spinactinospora alkalitolerans]|uniref:DHA1 family bicyclomycin/chloramphenicol resistance-like MFS transporter n=1 Tax=Spinactinospora alkalitolerans TaxID=687207 RepID=A0A852U1P4_9ACTN|nr:multidrug effflux MFS transporter [Spinactinospora alkalitolerans]NYE48893.1 DHA1 family bicyclomycin/chloramphenicol resistance-like MFS transporter [Spinactinospora alkalitolerans]
MTAGGAAARRSGAILVVGLGALTAVGPLSIDMYLPAFPELSRDLATGAPQVQLTLTACLVGLALGQLVIGPLSDSVGRRRPLLIGTACYSVISLLCAFAPAVEALTGLRFLQGVAGAAGMVIARAMVRDIYSGPAATRLFSRLMLIIGLAPILAPVFGGQLMLVTSWRGIFVTLAVLGVLLFALAWVVLKESLPPEKRRGDGPLAVVGVFARLLRDPVFLALMLTQALASVGLFGYVSGFSFVAQNVYGVSAQAFSLLFGLNGLGMVVFSQVNGFLAGRVSERSVLTVVLSVAAASGVGLLLVTVAGLPFAFTCALLFVIMCSLSFTMPNTTSLALGRYPLNAGSASALLGTVQFLIGATASPLVGLAGEDSAMGMALVVMAGLVGAFLANLWSRRASGPGAAERTRD